jgi:hypothetical protein
MAEQSVPSPALQRLLSLAGEALLAQVGHPRRLASWPARLLAWRAALRPGPDGVTLAHGGWVPRNAAAWTHGNWVIARQAEPLSRPLLNHEYVHVLQYRAAGTLRFYRRYLGHLLRAWRRRRTIWEVSPYEQQAEAIEALYRAHPELPDLWELGARL